MTLTVERAKALSDYLVSDNERAKRLVELSADEAVKHINADGHDYTIEELKEFGEVANKAAEVLTENDEMSEEQLGEVSGGSQIWAGIGIGIRAAYQILRCSNIRQFAW